MPDQILQAPIIQATASVRDSDVSCDFALDDEPVGEEDDESDARAIQSSFVKNTQTDSESHQ